MRSALLSLSLLLAVAIFCDASSDALELTPETFDPTVEGNSHTLVAFTAPWCGHCKRLEPEYEQAAKLLKERGVNAVLAKVNADEHKTLANRFSIQGFPTLKWFVNGNPTEYKGGRTAADIAAWVSKRVSDPVTKLASAEEANKFITDNEFAIIGFVDANHDDAKVLGQQAAADDNLNYGIVSDSAVAAELGHSIPSIVSFRPEILPHQTRSVRMSDEISAANIAKFASTASIGLVTEFSQETAGKIFGQDIKTQVLLFTDKASASSASLRDEFLAAAAASSGKGVFVHVDSSNSQVLEYFGVKSEDMPTVFIVHAEPQGMKKYQIPEKPSKDSVIAFLDSYHAGNAKAHVKSEPEPEDNSGPVKIITGNNFDQIVNDATKDVLLEAYAPWCGHCQKLVPIYEKLGKDLSSINSIVIAKMDATANDPPSYVNIRGFPTILLFPANDKKNPIPFEGDRTLKGFKKFLSDKASIPFTLPKKQKKSETVSE